MGIDFKSKLNQNQYSAVCHRDGPMLIIAGAGSGKTNTLVHRIAKLVEDGINPENILLLTFTNKAAEEMISRAKRMLDYQGENSRFIEASTYHSFAAKMLRIYGKHIGLSSNFIIADSPKSTDIINLVRESMGYNKRCKELPASGVLSSIYSAHVNKEKSIESIVREDYLKFTKSIDIILAIYEGYREYKVENDILDYDDILVRFNDLLEKNQALRAGVSRKFRYIMVDEYQDSNNIQSKMLQLLCYSHNNLCAVGDEQQSIYSFRGSNVKNILNFPNEFHGTKIVVLDTNYRSTQSILNLANNIILNARDKYEKELKSVLEVGRKPKLICTETMKDETDFVLNEITELIHNGKSPRDIAVLSRKSRETAFIEIGLQRNGIPFKKFGGIKFLDKSHIRDIISYLSILVNDTDEVAWFRVLQLYTGIGSTSANKIKNEIMQCNSYDGLVSPKFAKAKYYPYLVELHEIIMDLSGKSLADQLHYFIERYLPSIFEVEYPTDFDVRLKESELLYELADRYKTAKTFLDEITLESPVFSDSKEYVTISTIHSAKGLEFDTVFIMNCADEEPYQEPATEKEWEEEEENRRLYYVAVTRAKKQLYLMFAQFISPYAVGYPSHFITEARNCIDVKYID